MVLRNTLHTSGTRALRDRKLAPEYSGPFQVLEQVRHEDGTYSNTVKVKHVNSDHTESFHHSTLRIFAGTLEEAKSLEDIDNMEHPIDEITSFSGDPAMRSDMAFLVEYKQGEAHQVPYAIMKFTAAFVSYVSQFIWGKSILMSAAELLKYNTNTNPSHGESVSQAIQRLDPSRQFVVNEKFWFSAFFFSSNAFSILDDENDLPTMIGEVSTVCREPLFHVRVTKIMKKYIELDWPELARSSSHPYRRNITLSTRLLWTMPISDLDSTHQYPLTIAALKRCNLKNKLQPSNWPKQPVVSSGAVPLARRPARRV